MIKTKALEEGIQQFKSITGEDIQVIYYEPKYLTDLSLDIEFTRDPYLWPKKPDNPVIPENRKNILLHGYKGYLRELGFYGFVIYGTKLKLCYHVRERKGFISNI